MTTPPTLEIPKALRELAEKNVAQTKAAYDQFQAMARQARDMVPQAPMGEMKGAADVQAKALRIAEQNIDAGFRLAKELAQARDLQEYVEIQTRFAQTQALTYHQQAQDLGRLVVEAVQKATPGSK